jgi:hypothetical protein
MIWRDNLNASTISTTIRQTQHCITALESTIDAAIEKVLERLKNGLYDRTPGEQAKVVESQGESKEGRSVPQNSLTATQAWNLRSQRGLMPPPGVAYEDPKVKDTVQELVLAYAAIKTADQKLRALANGTQQAQLYAMVWGSRTISHVRLLSHNERTNT